MSTGRFFRRSSAPNFLKQIDARHARHVPVGDEEIKVAIEQHRQGRIAVIGFLCVGKT